MIILISKYKLLKTAVMIAIIVVLALGTFSYINYRNTENKLGQLIQNTNISNKTSLTVFLAFEDLNAQARKNIEIFDVSKGKVVKTLESTSVIQQETKKYLEGITGLYIRVKALPENGFIVRVPLEPPVKIKNKWIDATLDEVFIIFPLDKAPYLLILDKAARPYFYTFTGDTSELLKNLGYPQ
jgi:hypothetical protein